METSQGPRNWQLPFFTIWTGQAFSVLGSQLVQFALVWWLTQETGSAMVLATAALVGMLPGILLGPFAGALVDRTNRRRVMLVADGGIALATLGLALLYAAGIMRPWHIYAIMMIRSLGGTFHWPAMQASTSLMVPRKHLARVQGANQTLFGALNIVSPPLGAVLIELLPLHGVLGIDIGTALLAIVPLLFVAIPQPPRLSEAGAAFKTTLWQDVVEGLRYVAGWTGLCLIGLMATMINMLFTPAMTLLPLVVTKHFGGQALELGWLNSAWGAGVVLGGLTLSVWGGFKRRMVTSLTGVIGMGVGSLLMGFAPAGALWLALAGMFMAGLMNPIANGPLFAAVQATVAPEVQGRVFTLMGSVASAVSPLGLLIAGPVADQFGAQTWFLLGGAMCLLMGAGALFVPAIMNLEQGRAQPAAVAGVSVEPSPE
jgi:DHA3 family macrolide efflux protein-like MFS transporter